MTIFVEITGAHRSSWNQVAPMPGLSLQIPPGVGEQALIILNVPAPYLTDHLSIGGGYGVFSLSVDGAKLPVEAKFNGPDYVRVPATVVTAVSLGPKAKTIAALWGGFDVFTHIDSPASLSALF